MYIEYRSNRKVRGIRRQGKIENISIIPTSMTESGQYYSYLYFLEKEVEFLARSVREVQKEISCIHRIKCLFSGPLAYIFSAYDTSSVTFSNIISEAKTKGWIKSDPREDICGKEEVQKLLLLAEEFNMLLEQSDISVENPIPPPLRTLHDLVEFQAAYPILDAFFLKKKEQQKQGSVLRYIGEMHIPEKRLQLKLESVPEDSPFGLALPNQSILEIYQTPQCKHPIIVQGKDSI